MGKADDNGYCCVTVGTKTICRDDRIYYFKDGTTYDQCGRACSYEGLTKQTDGSYTATSISCKEGSCQSFTCPDTTWTYGKTSGYYGCVKNGITCYHHADYGPYKCKIDGIECGERCQTGNTDCAEWRIKQCAPMVTHNVDGVDVTKPACVYGRVQGTTDVDDYDYNCWCKGDVDSATNICCPSGQVVQGGACVLAQ